MEPDSGSGSAPLLPGRLCIQVPVLPVRLVRCPHSRKYDLGCSSRIRITDPGPDFFTRSGSRIRTTGTGSVYTSTTCEVGSLPSLFVLSLALSSASFLALKSFYPSRIQGSKRHRIRIRTTGTGPVYTSITCEAGSLPSLSVLSLARSSASFLAL
jgi:hypothetical protein